SDSDSEWGIELDVNLTGPKPGSGTIPINGGSRDPNGFGFDLDSEGNIAAIGANVTVWYTDGRTGANGPRVQDLSPEDIQQILANSPNASIDNFKTYGNDGKGHGSEGKSDIFLAGPHSGNEGLGGNGQWEKWTNLNEVKGNGNDSAPDYLLIKGDQSQYPAKSSVPHPSNGQVNHTDNVQFDGLPFNSNQLAGIIYSDGTTLGMPDSHLVAEYE